MYIVLEGIGWDMKPCLGICHIYLNSEKNIWKKKEASNVVFIEYAPGVKG